MCGYLAGLYSQLLEMKCDLSRKQTLLHYLVKVIAEKYPQLTGFTSDLHFPGQRSEMGGGWGSALGMDKGWERSQGAQDLEWDGNAASDSLFLYCPTSHSVSLDSVLGDVRSLQRGLELTQREFVRQDDCVVLKEFLRVNSPVMDKLLADSKAGSGGLRFSLIMQRGEGSVGGEGPLGRVV